MLIHPNFDAAALSLGPYTVPWLSLAMLMSLIVWYWLLRRLMHKPLSALPMIVRQLVLVAVCLGLALLSGPSVGRFFAEQFSEQIEINVYWYGITYLIAFIGCYGLGWYRAKTQPALCPLPLDQVSDLLFYVALGVVLGGRIGYILFYNLSVYLDNPWLILRVWEGGMSFHGGLLGVLLAMWLLARRQGLTFFQLADFAAPTIPFGLLCGRIGNFINGELWGKVTDLPWGMVFSGAGPQARHPSMLYEALLEGVLLWVILWFYSTKPRPRYAVSALFLLAYSTFRFAIEFVREPDAHIGYLAWGWLTMGHLLSLPMFCLGICLVAVIIYQHKTTVA